MLQVDLRSSPVSGRNAGQLQGMIPCSRARVVLAEPVRVQAVLHPAGEGRSTGAVRSPPAWPGNAGAVSCLSLCRSGDHRRVFSRDPDALEDPRSYRWSRGTRSICGPQCARSWMLAVPRWVVCGNDWPRAVPARGKDLNAGPCACPPAEPSAGRAGRSQRQAPRLEKDHLMAYRKTKDFQAEERARRTHYKAAPIALQPCPRCGD